MDPHGKGKKPRRFDRALRLTFEYEDDRFELIDRQKVDMVVPPSHELEPAEDEAASSWFTLHDPQGQPVYRRRVPEFFREEVEVFSEDGRLYHTPFEERRGTFTIIVPDVDEGKTLSFHGPPREREPDGKLKPAAERWRQKPKELARFEVAALQPRGKKS